MFRQFFKLLSTYHIKGEMSYGKGALFCNRLSTFQSNKMLMSVITSSFMRYYSGINGSTSRNGKTSLRLPIFWRRTDNRKRFVSTNNDNKDDEIVKIKRLYVKSPLKWFDIKVKMFLLRSYFDQDFEESEFLQGAKQAICMVTRFISEENFKGLTGMMSDKATEDSREMCRSVADKAKLRVNDEEIDNISVSNLGFVYDGKGRKWADILVTCHCTEDGLMVKKVESAGFVRLPSQRIFNVSFVREFTPGVAANWIIDRIAFSKAFSDSL